MNDATLLLRQIHPSFIREGRVVSAAFRPTPKDEDRLSVDDGDLISASAAFRRFTEDLKLASVGVCAVTVGECRTLDLAVDPDGRPYPEHVSIIFTGLSNKQRERTAKKLRGHAVDRGWQHRP